MTVVCFARGPGIAGLCAIQNHDSTKDDFVLEHVDLLVNDGHQSKPIFRIACNTYWSIEYRPKSTG